MSRPPPPTLPPPSFPPSPTLNLSSIPLIPFLSAHPFPAYLITLPSDFSISPIPSPLVPIWSNAAGLVDNASPTATASTIPSVLQDTLLSRLDQYSLVTLRGLVSRMARKLAAESASPTSSTSSSVALQRLGHKKRTRSEMDPAEGLVRGQDIIYIMASSEEESYEEAYYPTLIPVTSSAPTSPSSLSSPPHSTRHLSPNETLLVLQLTPLRNVPTASSKHRPITNTRPTVILPAGVSWARRGSGNNDSDVFHTGPSPLTPREELPESKMDSPEQDVDLEVNFGETGCESATTPTMEISEPRLQTRGKSSESGGRLTTVAMGGGDERKLVGLGMDVPGKVIARSSFGTRELLEQTDWSATSLGPKEEWPQSLKTAISIGSSRLPSPSWRGRSSPAFPFCFRVISHEHRTRVLVVVGSRVCANL